MKAAKVTMHVIPLGSRSAVEVRKWLSWKVDDDLFNANTFNAKLPATSENKALFTGGGQYFMIFLDSYLQMSGIIDERSEDTGIGTTDLHVSGRDMQGILMDSIVPPGLLSLKNLTVMNMAKRWVTDLWPDYVTTITGNNAANRYVMSGGSKQRRIYQATVPYVTASGAVVPFIVPTGGERRRGKFGKDSPYFAGISTKLRSTRAKLGDTIWPILADVAKQVGAIPFFTADGALCFCGPNYAGSPDAYGSGLTLRWDKKQKKAIGGNIQGVLYETSIAARKSEYVIAGLGKSAKKALGRALLLDGGVIRDPGPAFWAPKITPPYYGDRRLYKPGVIKATTQDVKLLTRYARRTMIEKALGGFNLEYRVNGHFAPSGAFWVKDTTVNVFDQRNGLKAVYYIIHVSKAEDVSGVHTTLKLWPTWLWMTLFDEPDKPDSLFYSAIAPRIDF